MKKTSHQGTPKSGATAKTPAKKAVKKTVRASGSSPKKPAPKKAVKKAVKKTTTKAAPKKTAAKSSPKKALKARAIPTRPTGAGKKPTKTAAKAATTKAAKKAAAKVAKAVKKAVKKAVAKTPPKKPVRASGSSPKTTAAVVSPKKAPRSARPKTFPERPVEKGFGFAPGIPDLPDAYGENRLVLMTKEPEYLFAYWEITPERFAESAKNKRANEDYREAMRLNWDARELLDTNFAVLPVRLDSRKWYMKVPYPGITYQVEIGWLSNQGHFIPILVSNPSDAPETWETTRLRLKNLKGMGAEADDVIDYHLRVTHPLGASEQGSVERIPVPKPARKELHDFGGPDSLSSSFGTKPQGSRRAPKARGPRK